MKRGPENQVTSESALLLVFRLDEQRFALPLSAVDRIVRAVEVTPLPGAPAIVLGAIDVQGRVVPVLGLRQRFGLPLRDVRPDDQFVLAHAAGRAVVLAIDEAEGVLRHAAGDIVSSAEFVPGLGQISGALKLEDGLVLIHDLENVLSLDDFAALDEALAREATYGA